jgi:hypothetical protein
MCKNVAQTGEKGLHPTFRIFPEPIPPSFLPVLMSGVASSCDQFTRRPSSQAGAPAMAKTKSKLDKKDVQQMEKDLKKLRYFLKALKSMGIKPPKSLPPIIKAIEIALKTGTSVADSAAEASRELRKQTDDLVAICKILENEDDQSVCEAEIARNFQWDATKMLDPEKPTSVTAKLINKAIKSATPDMLCKRWDRCAKIDKSKN